jgi:hypothetical protein
MSIPTTINVHIEADVDMTVDEVWPEGDAPEQVTPAAVKALMESSGTKSHVLNEWSLLVDPEVTVTVSTPNPEYQGDNVLFGDPPPRFVHDSTEVWD